MPAKPICVAMTNSEKNADEEDLKILEVNVSVPVHGELHGNLNQLFSFWECIRRDRFAPSWRDFDWMQTPIDLIPWTAVVDVVHDPLDFIFRFWGTARTTLQNQDFTGRSVREIRRSHSAVRALTNTNMSWRLKRPRKFLRRCTVTPLKRHEPITDSGCHSVMTGTMSQTSWESQCTTTLTLITRSIFRKRETQCFFAGLSSDCFGSESGTSRSVIECSLCSQIRTSIQCAVCSANNKDFELA